MENKQERITLYTGRLGKALFNKGDVFCASDKRLFDTDLAFAVDKGDTVFAMEDENFDCDLFDVMRVDSVKWE